MKETPTWYLISQEDERTGKLIYSTEGLTKWVLPPLSVLLNNESEREVVESALGDDNLDLMDFLDENFDLGNTLFLGETEEDYICISTIQSSIEAKQLYLIHEKRLATLGDIESWEQAYGEFLGETLQLYALGNPVEVVSIPGESNPRVFKATITPSYYTWKAGGEENEVIELEDNNDLEWILLSKRDAIQAIARTYDLTLLRGTYEYWQEQPYFELKTGQKVWAVESGIYQQASYIAYRDIPDLLDEIRSSIG